MDVLSYTMEFTRETGLDSLEMIRTVNEAQWIVHGYVMSNDI